MQIKRNGLTIKEMKEIITNVIREASQKENITKLIKVHPIVYIQFYNTEFFKKNFTICKPKEGVALLKTPIKKLGLNCNDTNEIMVFLGLFIINEKANKTQKHQLVDLLEITYHEFRHSYQAEKNNNYSQFEQLCINLIEPYIQKFNDRHYQQNHNKYLLELDADMYGINKTEQFLKDYKNIYEEEKEYINAKKLIDKFLLKNYDFDKIWQEFYSLYCTEDKNELPTNIVDFFNTFIDKKTNKYNSIETIFNNKNIKFLDEKVINSILTTKSFIKQLKTEELSQKEVDIMKRIIEYAKNEEEKLKEFNQKLLNNKIINNEIILQKIDKNNKKLKELSDLYSQIEMRELELMIEQKSNKRSI